jgi:hypothetical protein
MIARQLRKVILAKRKAIPAVAGSDYEDLHCLRAAKAAERDAPTIGIKEVKKRLTGRTRRSAGLAKKRASQ